MDHYPFLETTQPLLPHHQQHQIEPHPDETDQEPTRLRFIPVIQLLLKALLTLVYRLWAATVLVSLMLQIVRKSPFENVTHITGSSMDDREVLLYLKNTDLQIVLETRAVPALFGAGINDDAHGPIAVVDHDACRPFKMDFPTIHVKPSSNGALNSYNWYALVERGGCAFDKKVKMVQDAGFVGVILYNNDAENPDVTVRMAAHLVGKQITSFACFTSYRSGLFMKQLIESGDTPMVSIEYDGGPWRLLTKSLVDIMLLLILVIITTSFFFIIALTFNIGYNIALFGEPLALETIYETANFFLNPAPEDPNPPKLEKIDFPSRYLTSGDMKKDWRSGGIVGRESCPICIEDFEHGECVRDLPCQHTFHDTW